MSQDSFSVLPLVGMRALVTGGAQGIGESISMGLAASGAQVSVVDLQVGKASGVADQIAQLGGSAIAFGADISCEEDCRQAVISTVKSFGGLDILVNCAAPSRSKSMIGNLTGVDSDIHQKVMIDAVVTLADAAGAYLEVSGYGAIINISSVTSSLVAIDQCSWPYHVSKAGLDQLTRWLAVSLGPKGIRVNAIAAGLVDRSIGYKLTDNPENQEVIRSVVPLGRAGSGADIAQAVIFLCSKQSSYITGQVLTVDGGMGISEIFGTSLRTFKLGRLHTS